MSRIIISVVESQFNTGRFEVQIDDNLLHLTSSVPSHIFFS